MLARVLSAQRYRLTKTLGTGGMAQVFAAVAESGGVERRVAIKRMLKDLGGDEAAARMFLDEARIVSQLSHGNVVSVLDFGLVESDPFMVLEYVDGLDASRAVRTGARHERPMPPGVALHVIAEVAHALAYVHGRTGPDGAALHIVHRDVSPGNILCSWEGDVKLSDFGIAFATSRIEKTSTGVVKGKPSYMAPEQALGQAVDGSADVFALGNTLHTLLTGTPAKGPSELPWWLDAAAEPPISPGIEPVVASLLRPMLSQVASARPSAEVVAARAEALAKERLDTGGRTALRGWLADVRRLLEPDATLDQLFDVAIVPMPYAPDEPSGLRPSRSSQAPQFSVVRGAAAQTDSTRPGEQRTLAGPALGAEASPSPASSQAPATSRRAPSYAWRVALGALAVLASLGLAALSLRRTGVPETPPHAEAPRDVPEGPTLTPAAPEAPPSVPPTEQTRSLELAAHTIDPASPPLPTEHTEADDHTAREQAGRTTRAAVPEPSTEAPAATAQAAAELPPAPVDSHRAVSEPLARPRVDPSRDEALPTTGWIRVGGSALQGASLEVDGRREGYLPTLRRVGPGGHRVVVRRVEDGSVLLEREVVVLAEHTQTSPLVVR